MLGIVTLHVACWLNLVQLCDVEPILAPFATNVTVWLKLVIAWWLTSAFKFKDAPAVTTALVAALEVFHPSTLHPALVILGVVILHDPSVFHLVQLCDVDPMLAPLAAKLAVWVMLVIALYVTSPLKLLELPAATLAL